MSSIAISSYPEAALDKPTLERQSLFFSMFLLSRQRSRENEIRRCSRRSGVPLREPRPAKAGRAAASAQISSSQTSSSIGTVRKTSRESLRADINGLQAR
jgi:hypothetical protein